MSERLGPPLRAVRIVPKCPVCGKPAEEKYKPFCSKFCKDLSEIGKPNPYLLRQKPKV